MVQHQNAAQFQFVWAVLVVLTKVVATLSNYFGQGCSIATGHLLIVAIEDGELVPG